MIGGYTVILPNIFGDWVLNTAQLVYQLQHQHLIVERLDYILVGASMILWPPHNFKLVMVAGKLRFGPRLLKHALEDVHGSTLAVTAVACAEFHLNCLRIWAPFGPAENLPAGWVLSFWIRCFSFQGLTSRSFCRGLSLLHLLLCWFEWTDHKTS